ncbi:MAG: ABC transporter ATP-binding protein [Oscillospiraceae bacterium]
MLELRDVSVKYGGLTVVDNLSFSVDEGQWLMLVGPNGAGKSTVVSAISQGCKYSGDILFDGRDVKAMRPTLRAKSFGVLLQNSSPAYGFTVREVASLGRYAYSKSIFGGETQEDKKSIDEALEMAGLSNCAKQSVLTLSGGELQRCFLAQLFAQNPRLLILDEPTSHLDLSFQKQLLELVGGWVQKKGRAVISVVHDLSLARAFGTHALLMNAGRAVALGEKNDTLSDARLNEVYTMDVPEFMRSMLKVWKK